VPSNVQGRARVSVAHSPSRWYHSVSYLSSSPPMSSCPGPTTKLGVALVPAGSLPPPSSPSHTRSIQLLCTQCEFRTGWLLKPIACPGLRSAASLPLLPRLSSGYSTQVLSCPATLPVNIRTQVPTLQELRATNLCSIWAAELCPPCLSALAVSSPQELQAEDQPVAAHRLQRCRWPSSAQKRSWRGRCCSSVHACYCLTAVDLQRR
jgi:hypothetical protein